MSGAMKADQKAQKAPMSACPWMPKKTIFAACGCVNFVLLIVFSCLTASVMMTHKAIEGLCERLEASVDLNCRISTPSNRSGFEMPRCEHRCEPMHDEDGSLGPFRPGFFGFDGDVKQHWPTMRPKANYCVMRPGGANTMLAAFPYADCSCSASPFYVSIMPRSRFGGTPTRLDLGCARIFWDEKNDHLFEEGAPFWDTAKPCMYTPGFLDVAAELSLGTTKEAEQALCAEWLESYSMGSHYHWVYSSLCAVVGWCFLVSCAGFAEQIYRARKASKSAEKQAAYINDVHALNFQQDFDTTPNAATVGVRQGVPSEINLGNLDDMMMGFDKDGTGSADPSESTSAGSAEATPEIDLRRWGINAPENQV